MKWMCWSDWTMEISFYHLAWLPYKLDFLLSLNQQAVKKIRPLILGVILALSYSRTLSLWYGYYAPMQVYQHLPVINDTSPSTTTTTGILSSSFWVSHEHEEVLIYTLCRCTSGAVLFTVYLEDWDLSIWDGNLDAYVFWSNYVMRQWCWFRDGVLLMMRWMCLPLLVLIICWEISLHFKDDLLNTCGQVFLFGLCSGVSTICVGNEWYQYPSSFFLSSSNYQVGWLQDGFEGALPLPFVRAEGGTRSAPKYFNNKNKASPHQYVYF